MGGRGGAGTQGEGPVQGQGLGGNERRRGWSHSSGAGGPPTVRQLSAIPEFVALLMDQDTIVLGTAWT